jgi:hypothetical protein
MNFLTEISNKGFTIRCYYEKNNNRMGDLHLNTIYNQNLFPDNQNLNQPDEIDPVFSLLLSVIIANLEDDVSDPFDYNIDDDYGHITINNIGQIKIRLPPNIRDMFINNINNNYSYNDIINSILEKLKEYNDIYYIELLYKFKNMKVQTHHLNVIRANQYINIGIGKIFGYNQNNNFNIDDMINQFNQLQEYRN